MHTICIHSTHSCPLTISIHFTHSPAHYSYLFHTLTYKQFVFYPFHTLTCIQFVSVPHTHTPAHNLYSIHPTHSHNQFGIPGRSMGSVSLSREAFVHTHKLYRILSRKFIRVIYSNMANHYKDLSKHTHTRTLSLTHTYNLYRIPLNLRQLVISVVHCKRNLSRCKTGTSSSLTSSFAPNSRAQVTPHFTALQQRHTQPVSAAFWHPCKVKSTIGRSSCHLSDHCPMQAECLQHAMSKQACQSKSLEVSTTSGLFPELGSLNHLWPVSRLPGKSINRINSRMFTALKEALVVVCLLSDTLKHKAVGLFPYQPIPPGQVDRANGLARQGKIPLSLPLDRTNRPIPTARLRRWDKIYPSPWLGRSQVIGRYGECVTWQICAFPNPYQADRANLSLSSPISGRQGNLSTSLDKIDGANQFISISGRKGKSILLHRYGRWGRSFHFHIHIGQKGQIYPSFLCLDQADRANLPPHPYQADTATLSLLAHIRQVRQS